MKHKKTWWRRLKYWQWGSIILGGISAFVILLGILCYLNAAGGWALHCIPFFAHVFPIDSIVRLSYLWSDSVVLDFGLYFVLGTLMWAAIGALLGFIIGKVKEKC